MKHLYISIALILSVLIINAQELDSVLNNAEFRWTIKIPQEFKVVNADSVTKIKQRGLSYVEKTLNQKAEDNTKGIFFFKNNNFNYFESCSQPFDSLIDGNFSATNKLVYDIVYKTFVDQMKNTKIEIDTVCTTEEIDKLVFEKFRLKLTFPNGTSMKFLMYCRLFGKKQLAVNIMYMDEIRGAQMINAWQNSKFRK